MKPTVFLWLVLLFFSCKEEGKKLIWEENFDGNALNEAHWNFELGNGCPNLCGWGNNERQIYTKTNHKLENGMLTITANLKDSVYTSTRITTKNKFQFKYGTIEARAKLPVGQGLWPAFWMLGSNIDTVGWPKCGEIDILEYVGKEPSMVFTSLHTQDSHGETINTKKTKIEGIEDGFHVYKAHWTETKIEFFIDDKLLYTFAPEALNDETIWPFNQPFYILVNLAIGGNFGGPEVDDTVFPQQYIIDYIKVYK
ncbi:laminarinase [Tamlana nanhaiensis]|uniref:Laminarinase n=1 Tax=Neotamlana nanhaiensis TaxID=1382798 RepID=A0A0D7W4K2_9FLAO|nr:glycoside hydrolase family 16 protein [Tamlana nanhaiensis]KJD34065.1 laminarinase [Tamlana nanhaiensis]